MADSRNHYRLCAIPYIDANAMTRSFRIPFAILALVLTAIAGAIIVQIVTVITDWEMPAKAQAWQPADVKIIGVEGGHGSGFHIGNGLYITAAHVIEDGKAYRVQYENGNEHDAEILWTAPAYDVALLRIPDAHAITARLDCNEPAIGTPLVAKGNPLDMTFISMHGHVAGAAKEISRWKRGFFADLYVYGGMSGGPVYAGGNVVGMTVGHRMVQAGLGLVGTRFSVVVPASVICNLLGS